MESKQKPKAWRSYQFVGGLALGVGFVWWLSMLIAFRAIDPAAVILLFSGLGTFLIGTAAPWLSD